MDKYLNDLGQVGVLVSAGFGAGWSTWAAEGRDDNFYVMDRTLVEMKLKKASIDDVCLYCESLMGKAPYMGGWEDVHIEWLDKGTIFTIEEYDGDESIRLVSDLSMTA